MAKIIVITDCDMKGSGYLYLMMPILKGLVELGHEIKVAGLTYDGREHDYPFSIIPAKDVQDTVAIVNNLMYLWSPDLILVGLDIPLQISLYHTLGNFRRPYVAITPLENGPLTMSWAVKLAGMSHVFFISELGKQEALKAGLTHVDHLYIGVDTESWRPSFPEERKQIRSGLGIADDEFVVLSVADNQERKNLSAAMEIIAGLKEQSQRKVRFLLVTREFSPFGWNLRDLAVRLGINLEVNIYERGMPRDKLWGLYAVSDAYLCTSKAEGLCVLPDTRVWTGNGLKNIQYIEKGEQVVSDDGTLNFVTNTYVRSVNEDVNVLDVGFGLESIKVTSNHPILSVTNGGRIHKVLGTFRKLSSLEYRPARELKKGDYVFYPKPIEDFISYIQIDDYVENIKVEDGIVYSIGRTQFGSEFIHAASKESKLKNDLNIDKDFCSLLGWYVAEGCNTGEGLSFSLHWNEIEYREHIRRILIEKFSLELHDNFRDRNRYDGRVYSVVLGNLFSSLCGSDAKTKHLPEWALFLQDSETWSILESLFNGDGTYSSYDACLRYSTTSKELSRQIQFLLFRMGIVSTVRDSKTRLEYVVTVHRPEIFKIPFLKNEYIPRVNKVQSQFIELDDGWLLPIRSNTIEHYVGDVFNLEVKNRHSYLLAGGVVHNCLPAMDAMAMKIPVVATDTGALTELLRDSRGFLMPSAYSFTDVWGNSKRDMIDVKESIRSMRDMIFVMTEKPSAQDIIIDKAYEYVKTRTWDVPTKQVDDVIRGILNDPNK